MYYHISARITFSWILKTEVMLSLFYLSKGYLFLLLSLLIIDYLLSTFWVWNSSCYLIPVIWRWASRTCLHVLMLAFIFEQTKLSLCFPVFLHWVTLCSMIWSKTMQCKETHVPSYWKYEDCSFLLACGKESRSGVQKWWRNVSVITISLPHRINIRSWGMNGTGFFTEGYRENSIYVVYVYDTVEGHPSNSKTNISEYFQTHSYSNTILQSQGGKCCSLIKITS